MVTHVTPSKEAYFLNETVERRFSIARAVKIGDLLFVSGTVSVDSAGDVVGGGDMRMQLRTIYGNLAVTLEHFGARFENVVKETIFTTDMAAFLTAAADIRTSIYRDCTPPATTGVQVSGLAMPALLVEIEVIAALSVLSVDRSPSI